MKKLKTLLLAAGTLLLLPAATAADGFYTDGTRLRDANGNEFLMRGLNYSYGWQTDQSWVIKSTHDWGCNAIRINIGDGYNNGWLGKTDYGTLKWLIEECENNNLVGVFAPHNETGNDSKEALLHAANYWKEMASLVNEHRKTVLVNVTNEWMGKWDAKGWSEAYVEAIKIMREAGIKNTIIVDVAGWGQDGDVLSENGGAYAKAIIDADTEKNLMFSIHMYHVAARTEEDVRRNIDAGLALGVPLLIGEFAFEHKAHLQYPDGGPVAWKEILNYTREKRVSYLAWSWTGNGDGADTCDMFDGNGNIRENGKCMIYGNNGIKMTATDCSVFSDNPGHDQAYEFPEGPFDFEPYEGPGHDLVIIDPNAPGADEPFSQHLPYYIEGWNGSNSEFHIRPQFFTYATEECKVRVSVEGGGQIQIAYHNTDITDGETWTKIIDYETVQDGTYEIALGRAAQQNAPARVRDVNGDASHPDLLRHAKQRGMYLKGVNYTINKVELIGPDGGVVTGIEAIEADQTSAEIYDLTGRRVNEMRPGGVYIVKQGNKIRKVVM